MIKLAPSLLSADFAALLADIEKAEKAGVEYLHIDVMDGCFVPNITVGLPVIESLRARSCLCFDVHLMIEDPDRYVERFIAAGADLVTVHVEACRHLHRTLSHIKEKGALAGVALNPATPAAAVEHILHLTDLVLVMTVNPGFGGQEFIPEMLPKIRQIKNMLAARGIDAELQVDGGVNPSVAPDIIAAGGTVLVAGKSVFGAPDVARAVEELRKSAAVT
ncbi:MAG: ribulose-phosphate 3-epimerase [Peptococcaceae bacterium]|nr:MAG: ribulose-phosphate 3-epimerase [Peptococcaceae bacterium]